MPSLGSQKVLFGNGQKISFMLLFVGQDTLSEALLCFGASSTSIDETDVKESSDEVNMFLITFRLLFQGYFYVFGLVFCA